MAAEVNVADGMRYAPKGKSAPVVAPGEFVFAATGLDHGHISGMCNGLLEAGATLKWVYDRDPEKVQAFLADYPMAKVARSEDEILSDPEVKLVAAAAVPNMRCALGVRVMEAGKDYFTDKTPMTSLEQLDLAKRKVKETGRKYLVYFSERLHVESAVYAEQLIREGAIGRVIHTIGLGPHRLNAPSRPDWFFDREQYGGILTDIGSHQAEQFLFFSGAKNATVGRSQIANYNHPEYPELDDFGDCVLVGDNGVTGYFRIDWFTPDGLSTWGDGRTIILGTDGYIELRKYVNVAAERSGNHVYLVNHEGEQHFSVGGHVGCPFFGKMILDCINRTEHMMTQEHTFKAAELCLLAQKQAVELTGR